MEEFDFVDHYGDADEVAQTNELPQNEVECALNCAFIGVGGGGGKLAKAFLDIGFSKTLLINTTAKDQPDNVDPKHLVLIPDADGVAKNVEFGKDVLDRIGVSKTDKVEVKAPQGIFLLPRKNDDEDGTEEGTNDI